MPVVDAGHGRVDRDLVSMSELMMPVGLSVAHCAFKLEKSGDTGVGVPCRVKPSAMLLPVAVGSAGGPYEIRP